MEGPAELGAPLFHNYFIFLSSRELRSRSRRSGRRGRNGESRAASRVREPRKMSEGHRGGDWQWGRESRQVCS